tara:strand:- start:216 stop:470 length:255 start_codon:yes stop_codon:yes gene_type:complete
MVSHFSTFKDTGFQTDGSGVCATGSPRFRYGGCIECPWPCHKTEGPWVAGGGSVAGVDKSIAENTQGGCCVQQIGLDAIENAGV